MIKLPNFDKAFEYENNFYLSSDITRIGKIIAHYELYKMINNLPGAIVECGVFKGTSLIRFATFRALFENTFSRQIIGFDTFANFPETKFDADKKMRQDHVKLGKSISKQQLQAILKQKGIDKGIQLIEGDIKKTLPDYLKQHSELKISLLNIDVDIYEPTVTILDLLYSKVVKGGIILLDDYGFFPGETKAVDDFFKNKNIKIQKMSFCMTPSYIVKP